MIRGPVAGSNRTNGNVAEKLTDIDLPGLG
jgi:hypothetical protein